jgi:hypothetical protein
MRALNRYLAGRHLATNYSALLSSRVDQPRGTVPASGHGCCCSPAIVVSVGVPPSGVIGYVESTGAVTPRATAPATPARCVGVSLRRGTCRRGSCEHPPVGWYAADGTQSERDSVATASTRRQWRAGWGQPQI